MKRIAALLIILLVQSARADADGFAKANEEFSAGNYKAAIADYEALVAARQWSANLFYDLANAYFHERDSGRAILNYERALEIDPHHPEAEANLRLARDQTRGLELTPGAAEKYLSRVGTSKIVVVAAVLFWLAIFLLVNVVAAVAGRGSVVTSKDLPRPATAATAKRARGGSLAGAIACLLVCAGCVWAAWTLENGTQGKGAAVVVAENAEARVATADTAKSMLVLPAGSEVVILQKRGDWNYAVLPNKQRGWIPATAAETVRL